MSGEACRGMTIGLVEAQDFQTIERIAFDGTDHQPGGLEDSAGREAADLRVGSCTDEKITARSMVLAVSPLSAPGPPVSRVGVSTGSAWYVGRAWGHAGDAPAFGHG